MVWHFALMACDHDLSPVDAPLSLSIRPRDGHLVAYCANSKSSTLEKLRDTVSAHLGQTVVLTWAPEQVTSALAELAGRVTVVSVPNDIRRVFRQGKRREDVAATEVEA